MIHDIDWRATPCMAAVLLPFGSLTPAPAPPPVRCSLDELFPWHRIRRLPRK